MAQFELGEGLAGIELSAVSSLTRAEAKLYAQELLSSLSKGKMPRAITVVRNTKTGQIFLGRSGELIDEENINQTLVDKMNHGSKEKWPIENCSECGALNKALNAGSEWENLEMHTLRLDKKTSEVSNFPKCENCKVTTKGIKTTSEPKSKR